MRQRAHVLHRLLQGFIQRYMTVIAFTCTGYHKVSRFYQTRSWHITKGSTFKRGTHFVCSTLTSTEISVSTVRRVRGAETERNQPHQGFRCLLQGVELNEHSCHKTDWPKCFLDLESCGCHAPNLTPNTFWIKTSHIAWVLKSTMLAAVECVCRMVSKI